jgi:hypothetical protein
LFGGVWHAFTISGLSGNLNRCWPAYTLVPDNQILVFFKPEIGYEAIKPTPALQDRAAERRGFEKSGIGVPGETLRRPMWKVSGRVATKEECHAKNICQ